jgi:SAM-dependent methyltransferase
VEQRTPDCSIRDAGHHIVLVLTNTIFISDRLCTTGYRFTIETGAQWEGTVAIISESGKAFVPGMGVEWLLPVYDPLTRLLRLDRARRELVVQADLQPRHRVLDIGCGTGSLAVLIKRLFPSVEVVGLDPEEKALARARRKAQRAGVAIQFDRGFSDAMDYPAGSFDRVFSSFMFHHLERADKERTLREIRRVLKDGGRLHLLDFDGPESGRHGARLRGLHSHPRLNDNGRSTVVALMANAGLSDARTTGDRTLLAGFIRIAYYQSGRSLI